MMIDRGRYTSGRIALANLSTSIDGLERERAASASFESLLTLAKLFFLRGDLLGSVADHDRGTQSPPKRLTCRPTAQERSMFARRSRDASTVSRKRKGFSLKHWWLDIRDRKLKQNGRLCFRRPDTTTKRWSCAKDWRSAILGLIRLQASRRCWRRWINGEGRRPAIWLRSTPTMACLLSRAGNFSSNGE